MHKTHRNIAGIVAYSPVGRLEIGLSHSWRASRYLHEWKIRYISLQISWI